MISEYLIMIYNIYKWNFLIGLETKEFRFISEQFFHYDALISKNFGMLRIDEKYFFFCSSSDTTIVFNFWPKKLFWSGLVHIFEMNLGARMNPKIHPKVLC